MSRWFSVQEDKLLRIFYTKQAEMKDTPALHRLTFYFLAAVSLGKKISTVIIGQVAYLYLDISNKWLWVHGQFKICSTRGQLSAYHTLLKGTVYSSL